MVLNFLLATLCAVCREEEGRGHLGLQGLWESQSWRCLHFEVNILLMHSSNFLSTLLFPVFNQTNCVLPLLFFVAPLLL